MPIPPSPPPVPAASLHNACNVECRRCRSPGCEGVVVFFIGEGISPLEPGQRATARCGECGSGHALWRVAEQPVGTAEQVAPGATDVPRPHEDERRHAGGAGREPDAHDPFGHGHRRRRVGHTLK